MIGVLLLTVLQAVLFACSLWAILQLVGRDPGLLLVMGVPFFALLTLIPNIVAKVSPAPFARKTATGVVLMVHALAYAEDFGSNFMFSALVAIICGSLLFLGRTKLRNWLDTRVPWPTN